MIPSTGSILPGMKPEAHDTDTVGGPLTGIRVLDFTERMQGPYGTQILADFGADVLKVERAQALTPDGRPDERYGSRYLYGKDPEDSRFYTAGFLAANRNKRSIAIDLKNEQGREVARRLVGICDVVYENFRPGVMERLGLGYEVCRAINPSVIYASASGYGQSGPYVDLPGQDVLDPGGGRLRGHERRRQRAPGTGRYVDHRRHGGNERGDRSAGGPGAPGADRERASGWTSRCWRVASPPSPSKRSTS